MKVKNKWTSFMLSVFSRAVLTALFFKWGKNFGWNLTISHKFCLLLGDFSESMLWIGWFRVVTWHFGEIWPKEKWPADRGDQELSKTFRRLKIGPLLTKLQAFKDRHFSASNRKWSDMKWWKSAKNWYPHGQHVDTTWLPCGHHVVSRWTLLVSTWTLSCFHIDTTWFWTGN